MRTSLLCSFFLFMITYSLAQDRADLIGTWKVTSVGISKNALTPEAAKQTEVLDMLQTNFATSEFTFAEDGKFTFDIATPDIAIADGFWQFDPYKKAAYITQWEDREQENPALLMSVQILKKEQEITFYIDETPIFLTVQKL